MNWHNIRSFNNSQNNAFEELICQLARDEEIENKVEFYRVADPDGGIEAYCILDNGDEYGWQAKYFFSMGDSQWGQLTKSIKRALETHPKLKKYYICIPLDRQDPRVDGQEWFMDKWRKKVEEWTKYAESLGREISFVYWGSSELTHRLSQEKHAGRRLFWFSEEEFSNSWFEDNVNNSISNLGKRYLPELNVELEVAKKFDTISQNSSFHKFLEENLHEFMLQINKTLSSLERIPVEDEFVIIRIALDNIKDEIISSIQYELKYFDIDGIEENIIVINNSFSIIDKYIDENKHNNIDSDNSLRNAILSATRTTYEFLEFIQSPVFKLANYPIAFLTGPAGVGKSHLLADVASNNIKNGNPCVFLLGQHFTSEESPWTQILRNLLRVDCNERELLGALNARAEAQGERLLIFIDGINEGRGRYFWPDHISGFINEVSKYPWIGLVLSVRSSYEELLIPNNLVSDNKIIKISHYGFSGVEYEATRFIFSQYNIEFPSIPLLHPEFSNPLFVILFCEGLNRAGYTKIPKGYRGMSSVIDFFIDSVDEKLSKPGAFDYPPNQKLVRQVINALVEYKLQYNLDIVPYQDAFIIADEILKKFSNERRFIDALISEGVLAKNLIWEKDGEYEEYVYFAYERFSDHFIASNLLDHYLEDCNFNDAFKTSEGLSSYVLNQGIIEALSIQIPERIGKELYELLDEEKRSSLSIKEAFINSLIWRKAETIGESSIEYINKYILCDKYTFDLFFDMVYSISFDSDHPYNADRLHKYLMQFTLAERDAIWTIYLHDKYHEGTAIFRLIDWANSNDNKTYLSDDSRLLASKALAWVFTSTNIILRDSATKALVLILENNLVIVPELLTDFEGINDPYVYERLFAAIYGAVLRSEDIEGLGTISQYIIETIFEKDEVYPNILVRDYARNIVEYALYRSCIDLKNSNIIRPPYKSSFPSKYPTNEEIDSYYYDHNDEDFKDYYLGQNVLLSSMITEYGRGISAYGDFGRYTFQYAFRSWEDLDSNDLSNYACKLIFEKYGYDVEKHGRFDFNIGKEYWREYKTERIGKKYQWIALYEVLARVSDNFKMVDESTNWGENKSYIYFQGPWDPFIRNIDPTIVPNDLSKNKKYEKIIVCHDYKDWDDSNEDWIVSDKNLPNLENILLNDNDFLVLESHLDWGEPIPIGQDKYRKPRKRLWYQIRSYFVKKDEMDRLIPWLKKQHFMGRWFPEGGSLSSIFSRELFWSPAYQYFSNEYYGGTDWKRVISGEDIIACVLPTSEEHTWDYELNDGEQLSYLVPNKYIYSGMGLQYSNAVGEWLNKDGQIVVYSSLRDNSGSSSLLMRKDFLIQYLLENDLAIFWTCLGEKQILGDFRNHPKEWLEISGVYVMKDGDIFGTLKPIIDGR